MKSYEQKSWSLPQPILIIGTYDKKQKAITHANGKRLKQPVAQVFNIIVDYSDEIKAQLTHPSTEMLMLIKDFNPILLNYSDMYEAWLNICCGFAENYGVPLREWIETKPSFSFSK